MTQHYIRAIATLAIMLVGSGNIGLSAQASPPNDTPLLPQARAWRIAERPLLTASTLELNRVVGLLSLADGRIVVANDPSELIFLAPNGTVVSRSGRSGEGPGEFEHLSALGRLGVNQLWATDQPRGILSIWNTSGQFERTIPLRQLIPKNGMTPRGQLADGRLVLYSGGVLLNVPLTRGVDSSEIIAFDPNTQRFTSLARIPSIDTGNPTGSKLFGAPTFVAARTDAIYWGHGEEFVIHRIAPDGSSLGTIRKAGSLPRVTSQMWREYVDERVSRVSGTGNAREARRQSLRTELEKLERPTVLPAYGAILLDHEGNVWVREYGVGRASRLEWNVFNPQGRWITSLRFPELFTPWEISQRGVLGVQRDEFDLETVVLLRLEKPN